MMKRTKIVCTIGPASEDINVLEKMVIAGLDVARLNFSHGTHGNHSQLIEKIRSLSKKYNKPIAIIQDLQGPRVRVGLLPNNGITLCRGKEIILTCQKNSKYQEGEIMVIPVTHENLCQDVKTGQTILLDDGQIILKVKKVEQQLIHCQVESHDCKLISHKGINVPEAKLSVPTLTEKDKDDLQFGIKNNVDFVALSFVREAEDIIGAKKIIGDKNIKIISKIEKREAIKNFDEILKASDAIMVARGDLGIEMPAEEVPILQKRIIDSCLKSAKPVIVATQMLDSMIRNPRPTRAEVSDVANAVIDHTDAVMLSGESASGKYPVQAIETMQKIILQTEKSHYDNLVFTDSLKKMPIDSAISEVANILAKSVDAKIILAASLSGETGRIVSRYRPELPIFVATDNEKTEHQVYLSWGVYPFLIPTCATVEELIAKSIEYIKENKIVTKKDKIIIIAGEPVGKSGVNLVEIKEI
ncbi:MAG: pyruvate kinase [Patescibacteria group bacterium]|nr:pyruvate kinase [Patescibacteria group bacterium]